MRARRIRGLGCLGCLPFGGLFALLLPVIIIAALVYFLVNRQKVAPPPTYPAPPGPPQPPRPAPPSGGFCPHCGAATTPGTHFCTNCGNRFD